MKRIRLTIEWDGACSEERWADILAELIEGNDASRVTRVSKIELLTRHGGTDPVLVGPPNEEVSKGGAVREKRV